MTSNDTSNTEVEKENGDVILYEHMAPLDITMLNVYEKKPMCPLELDKLMLDHGSNPRVLRWVVQHPDTMGSTLARMYRDFKCDSDLLVHIARHPNTPDTIRSDFGCGSDEGLAYFTAINPKTSSSVLEDMRVACGFDMVRYEVVRNPSTSRETLERMTTDADLQIRTKASSLIAIQDERNPEKLGHLAAHDHISRLYVARNPHTDPEVLSGLAQDPDAEVRQKVATNPSTPFESLLLLTSDPDEDVRHAAMETIEERGVLGMLGEI